MSTDNFREKDYYKDKIVEMVEKIEKTALLIKILSFVEAWLEE